LCARQTKWKSDCNDNNLNLNGFLFQLWKSKSKSHYFLLFSLFKIDFGFNNLTQNAIVVDRERGGECDGVSVKNHFQRQQGD
jgi:hypothetical protein